MTLPLVVPLKDLSVSLHELGGRRPLVICSRSAGRLSVVESALQGLQSVGHVPFHGANPTLSQVEAALSDAAERRPDCVVAVGGGSAIDFAKAIALFLPQPDLCRSLLDGSVQPRFSALPLIAVPTTAGSGSEATHFASIYHGEKKRSLAHPSLRPALACLEPAVLASLAGRQLAESALDALCHGIEACWSRNATSVSRALALKSISLLWPIVSSRPALTSSNSRAALLKGAHLAGQAINISKTTAAHAYSYWLTTTFGIAHGHAVGLMMGIILHHVDEEAENDRRLRYAIEAICRAAGTSGLSDLRCGIRRILRDAGLAHSIAGCGPEFPSAADIWRRGDPDRLSNHPTPISEVAFVRAAVKSNET
ncbi:MULTISPECIES: iron-containing alcohol dehydrogenase [unclassified Bradyrhizobium]|uniref:iron-containing alcohol dehydrogenase n=1 Tax=unclassified Bradyrhizobium TaxID=2631580 RepID=UPI0028EE982A|nr:MULTISPECIES: iron-containing alcohol dehydrogenase [unclassified Bradyrhizobium]